MSIATKRGDGGQTSLAGGIRVSKSDLRVECYGTTDELKSQMGFARSICQDADIAGCVERIQRELYKVGSAIATVIGEHQGKDKIVAKVTELCRALADSIHAAAGDKVGA